jgi:hypothetical protein
MPSLVDMAKHRTGLQRLELESDHLPHADRNHGLQPLATAERRE